MQLVVGRIGRAHGLRGEVAVEVRTDEPERRLGPGAVVLTDPPARGPLTVAGGRVHSGRLLLRFEGYDDRTAAESLRGTVLVAEVDPDESPEDPEEFYDHQLVGLTVVAPGGEVLGEVLEVLHLPGQDVLAVTHRPPWASAPLEVLVPFVAAIVPEVDVEGDRVVVDAPPGLFPEPAEADATGADEASEGTGEL